MTHSERHATRRGKVLVFVLLLFGVAIAVLMIATDERINCQFDNFSKGYSLTSDDFSPSISVVGSADKREVDFTKLHQFKRVCIVEMYTYGEPYSISDPSVRLEGRRACWRETPGKLTVVGVSADGSSHWSQVAVDRQTDFYLVAGDSCADTTSAILRCQNYTCSFAGH